MTELIELFLILAACITVTIWLVFFIRRLSLLLSLRGIRRTEGVYVKFKLLPLAFLPFTAKKPIATVRVREKLFDIYLYHGGGRWRYVHIANDRYSVVYTKLGGMTPKGISNSTATNKRVLVNMPTGVGSAKVRLLPEGNGGIGTPLLVFSPAPAELTYVSEERTSIKVAFTGERIGKWQIFTKETLINYLDRESRGFYD